VAFPLLQITELGSIVTLLTGVAAEPLSFEGSEPAPAPVLLSVPFPEDEELVPFPDEELVPLSLAPDPPIGVPVLELSLDTHTPLTRVPFVQFVPLVLLDPALTAPAPVPVLPFVDELGLVEALAFVLVAFVLLTPVATIVRQVPLTRPVPFGQFPLASGDITLPLELPV